MPSRFAAIPQFAQAFPPATIEAVEDMASPAAKKARAAQPKAYTEIDLETTSMKVVEGKDDKFYLPLFDGESTRIILTHSGPTTIAFGFDMKGAYEQRSFNSKGVKQKGTESLAIRVELDNDQVSFIEAVEERFKSLFPEGDGGEWTSPLSVDKRDGSKNAKISVCLSGEESAQTLLKFKQSDEVVSGRGWDFLKERADVDKAGNYAFAGGEVKVVVRLRAYRTLGKDGKHIRGITLAATQLFIKPRERVIIEEIDVLDEW